MTPTARKLPQRPDATSRILLVTSSCYNDNDQDNDNSDGDNDGGDS